MTVSLWKRGDQGESEANSMADDLIDVKMSNKLLVPSSIDEIGDDNIW